MINNDPGFLDRKAENINCFNLLFNTYIDCIVAWQ